MIAHQATTASNVSTMKKAANFSKPKAKKLSRGYRELLRPLYGPIADNKLLVAITTLMGCGKFMLPLIIGYALTMIVAFLESDSASREQRFAALWDWSYIGLITIIACAVTTYYRAAFGHKLMARIQHRLRRRLFFHLQRLGMDFFAKHHAGALGSRVSSDIQHVGMVVDRGLITMFMDVMTIAVITGILISENWQLTILTFAIMAASGVSIAYHSPRLRRRRKAVQESQSAITGRAAETFAGISLVKAYAGESETGRAFNDHSLELQDLQVDTSRLQGRFQSISLALVMSSQLVVLGYGGWLAIAHPGLLSVSSLVLFMLYLRWIEGSVQRVVDGMVQLQDGFAALDRLGDMLSIQPNPAEPPAGKRPDLQGEIRFDQVNFAYENGKPVISNLHLNLSAGKTFALVGPSGGGKSSLCKLMLRFHDPQKGSVRIDGYDLRDLDGTWFRQRVAVVLQDPIMFSTTIEENIAFGKDNATSEDVQRAAKLAQAHDFIQELPDGYQTKLGERGVNLSGGQRQRVALARALMRDPCLLILDEATSALDSVTEHAIQDVIDDLKGSRTIVIIAHRLSTIKHVDEVVVIEQGEMTERGRYEELVHNGGTFAQLVEEQNLIQANAH